MAAFLKVSLGKLRLKKGRLRKILRAQHQRRISIACASCECLNSAQMTRLDYKQAGVDVDAGDQLVDWLQRSATPRGPHHDRIVSGIGGFAALFRMPTSGYKQPLLVSSTDGVGTKVKIASHFKDYSTVGQDLVAMCVNDLLCCGADPLFFLDYYATGKLDVSAAQQFLSSVRKACHESDCALIGGETAEMPGVYQQNDFDCAGFSVGIVDEAETLGAHRVQLGHVVIAIESSGFHSNGFSLLRKVFAADLETWREVLLRPTHLYTKLAKTLRTAGLAQAFANITGGGMENIPRVLPKGTAIKLRHWDFPKEFAEVQKRTGLSRTEMLKTLNCGVGFAVVVESKVAQEASRLISELGFKNFLLGEVIKGNDSAAEAQVLYE